MMSLIAVSGSILCALVMSSALHNEPEHRGDPAATSDDPSELVTVPDVLSFNVLDEVLDETDASDGEGADRDHGRRCKVELKKCHDKGRGPHFAEFCKKDCDDKEAQEKAREICEKECNHSACKRIRFTKKCH